MTKSHAINPPATNMKKAAPVLLLALSLLTGVIATPAYAGSATWSGQLNSNWNVFENWSPQTVPNGPSDLATLGGSNNRTVYLSASTEVNSITFPKPINPFFAVNYGITVSPALTLTVSGTGITNNSGQAQNFVVAASDGNVGEAELFFTNSATAGSAIFTNNSPTVSGVDGGITEFLDSATAGNCTFINNADGEIKFYGNTTAGSASFTNNGGDAGHFGGSIDFEFNSTAASATFTNNGGLGGSGATDGIIFFGGSSTAANAILTNNGSSVSNVSGGLLQFDGSSTAGSATLIANKGANGGGGGQIVFLQDSTGGFARVSVFGNGYLDISDNNAPGVSIGSIQGTGIVFLGSKDLTTGLNNLSTAFSGVIKDGGVYGTGTGGSLTKLGKGKLTLSRANTYTGGTTLNGGTLLVRNKTGSATGSGAVQANNGTLGGTGLISNAVTVGNGTLSGAILLAGNAAKSPGTLTINSTLTFQSMSSYTCGLKRSISSTGQVTAVAGKVTALGVTINSNVQFTLVDSGTGILPIGTVFTVINNTSPSPISGRFSNLAAGSTFISNGNTFKVSYAGGTGNDLTLQVVH